MILFSEIVSVLRIFKHAKKIKNCTPDLLSFVYNHGHLVSVGFI